MGMTVNRAWPFEQTLNSLSSTLDKLLFGVFIQLKFWKKQFKLNLWGKYPIISNSCTHLHNKVPKRKTPDTQFNEKWVGKNSPKYPIV